MSPPAQQRAERTRHDALAARTWRRLDAARTAQAKEQQRRLAFQASAVPTRYGTAEQRRRPARVIGGAVRQISGSPAAKDQGDQEQHQKDHEENLRDSDGSPCNPGETKDRGDQRNNQECNGPA